MDVASARAIERAITGLGTTARELSAVEVPRLFAGIADRSAAADVVQRGLSHAEQAVDALQGAGVGGTAVAQARRAATWLEHAAIDEVALRDLGRRLQTTTESIRTDPAVADAFGSALLDTPVDSFTPADFTALAEMVRRDSTVVDGMPRAIDGLPDALTVLDRAAAGDHDAVRTFGAYRDARLVHAMTVDERAGALESLVSRDTPLTSEESLRLSSLLDGSDALPAIADRTALAQLARTTALDHAPATASELERARFAARLASTGDVELGSLLDRSLAAPGQSLTPTQWGNLRDLLDHPRTASIRTLPGDEPGLKSLRTIADDFANERYGWDPRVQRYFDRYAVTSMSDDAFSTSLDALMTGDGSTLTPEQWSRLSMQLADPRSGAVTTRELPGLKSLTTIAGDYAGSAYGWDERVGAYFAAHQASRLDDTAVRSAFFELADRAPADLGASDWARLAGMSSDPRIAELLPGTIPGRPSFTAAMLAQTPVPPARDATAATYLQRVALARLGDDELHAAFDALTTRQASSLSAEDWSQLAALLSEPRMSPRVPANIAGLKPLAEIADDMASSRYLYDGRIQGYFTRIQIGSLPDEEVIGRFDQLMNRPGDQLTADDWAELLALVHDERVSPKVPAQLTDLKSFQQIASDLSHGAYPWDARVQRYFDRYALAGLGDEEIRAQFDTLMSGAAEQFTPQDWSRLSSMLADPRIAERAPAPIPGLKSFDTIASDYASSRYGWDGRVQGYFEQHAISKLDQAAIDSEFDQLMSREASQLTPAEWARASALISDHRIAQRVPETVSGLKPFAQIASDMAQQSYAYDARIQRYFERFRLAQLDDTTLRTQVSDLLQRQGSSLTKDDWARLAELLDTPRVATVTKLPRDVAGLKPFTQIANEMAAGMYAYDSRVDQFFADWAMRNDPAYVSRFEAAVEALASGTASAEQRSMVDAHPTELASLIAGRPADQRLAIALAMLGNDSVASSREVKGTLVAIRDSLEARDGLDGVLGDVVAQTRTLLDRNIARLNGTTPSDAVRGYSNHPDYAEIGRIRANLQLIERLEAGATTGAGVAENAVPAVDQAVEGAGTISW